jgi:shikimate kinase
LQDRLAKSRRRRPLLETDAWEDRLAQMLDSRRDLYLQADLHFQVESESLEDCAMHLFEFVSGANL